MKLLIITILLILMSSFASGKQTVWKGLTSTEGGFSVEMPGMPTSDIMTVNTNSGIKKSFMFTVKDEKFGDYLVAYSDSADIRTGNVSINKIFDEIRDGIISAAQGKLISEENITLNNHRGREIKVERSDGIILIERIYLVGRRFYQIAVETKKADVQSDHIKRFLNSFRLLKER